MAAQRQTIFRIAVLVAVLVAIAWLLFWKTSRTWQYEEVEEGVIYRASMRNEEEFTAAALDAQPNSLALIAGKSERDTQLFDRARAFGHRNKMRVLPLQVEPGEDPTESQLADLLGFMQRRPRPVLVADMDGVRAGKLIAAYRLQAAKMPLDEVLKRAELPDAPPGNTQQIREFAERFHARLPADPGPTTR